MAEKLQLDLEVNLGGDLEQRVQAIGQKLQEAEKSGDGGRSGRFAAQQYSSLQGMQDQINYFKSSTGRAFEARRLELQRELEEVKLPRPTMMQRLGGNLATDFGALGRAAVGIGAPAAGAMAIDRVANKVATALDIVGNSTTTLAQKQDALVKELVPFGATFIKLRDVLTGVTDGFRRLNEETERQTSRLAAESQLRTSVMSSQNEMFAAQSTASGMRAYGLPGWAGSGFDVSYAGDRIARQEAMRRYDAQAGVMRARRALLGASLNATTLSARAGGLEARASAAQGRMGTTSRALTVARTRQDGALDAVLGRSWVGALSLPATAVAGVMDFGGAGQRRLETSRAAQGANLAGTEFSNLQGEAMQARQAADQAMVAQRQRELDLQRAILATQREELEILNQKESRMSSLQVRLGMMTQGQRDLAESAARFIQQYGIANATPEMIQQANQLAPDMIRRLAEEEGGRLGGYYAGVFGTRDDFRDYGSGGMGLRDVRTNQDRMQRMLAEAADRIEVQFADVLSNTITEAFTRALEQFTNRFNAALQQFENRLWVRRTQE